MCALCGSASYRVLEKESQIIRATSPSKVVQCTRCGLMYLNPRPLPEHIKGIYDENYYRKYMTKSSMAGGNFEVSEAMKLKLAEVERQLSSKGSLLEIGCATGLFLNYARQKGWRVKGVEISPWASNLARLTYNIEVFTGTIEEARFADSTFNVVFMNHVLEHLPNPVGTLREVYRILRRKGVLVVEVPNEFDTLFEKVRELLGKPRVPYEIPSPHLYFFTASTLRCILAKSGFTIARLKTYRNKKEYSSRYIGGGFVKRVIYRIEEICNKGALIEVFAEKA